jgi:hypothetical protein
MAALQRNRRTEMTDRKKGPDHASSDWQGFREVDRAIAENRLTAYTWKKTWRIRGGALDCSFSRLSLPPSLFTS